MTYPAEEVSSYISEFFVAWRVNYDKETGLLRSYNVVWTPTLVFLDSKGTEQYRILGFIPPEIFMVHLVLARAKVAFGMRRYEEASELYDKMVKEFPGADEVPEAIYFRGVARYKATNGDDSHLVETSAELARSFPSSEWTARTVVW